MKSYEVYLTKSCEVAELISKSRSMEMEGVLSVGHGFADGKPFIPEVYHDQGYYYCKVERETDRPSYEIIFA